MYSTLTQITYIHACMHTCTYMQYIHQSHQKPTIHLHVFMHTCTCIHTYKCIHTLKRLDPKAHAYIRINMYMHIRINACMHTCTCIHTYKCVHIHLYVCTCNAHTCTAYIKAIKNQPYTYMFLCIHAHVYIHINVHIP